MDFIKKLKSEISIAEVVGEYVRLKKSGSNHMGLCPFHAERTPSFSVVEKKGIYHCFGCAKGGDAISFIQEIQGVGFNEAVSILAHKFQIPLPNDFKRRKGGNESAKEDKNSIYYKMNRFVADFYHRQLMGPRGEKARKYLLDRGISEETIRTRLLGFALDEWAELYDFLEEKKAPMNVAEQLGFIRKKSKNVPGQKRQHFDLFRNRVIFPVIDRRGRVVAFGGRLMEKADGPKYLNSPETPVFKKGTQFYGLFSAAKEIRAEGKCVVVEGFMDCLALQQAGMGYAIATLGTALTEEQARTINRTPNITLVFDGDSAGQEAQVRAMETFLNVGIVVRGVKLPEKSDPDDFIKENGIESLQKLVESAPYLLDREILKLRTEAGGQTEAKAQAVDKILPWIAKIPSNTVRMVRLGELEVVFGIPISSLTKRVNELRKEIDVKPNKVGQPLGSVRTAKLPRIDGVDARLIELLALNPRHSSEMVGCTDALDGIAHESTKKLVEKLAEKVKEEFSDQDVIDLVKDSPILNQLVAKALVQKERIEKDLEENQIEFEDLKLKLIRRGKERRRDNLRAMLLAAENSGESNEVKNLMKEYNALVKGLEV